MRLLLDPILCTAHGLCAELFPEEIALDEWGYPVITASTTSAEHVVHARAAAAACPARALRLAKEG